MQSALDPAGAGSRAIYGIWSLLFWVCTVVFVLIIAALAWAMARHTSRRPVETAPIVVPASRGERRIAQVVGVATAATLVILLVFTAASYSVGRALFSPAEPALEIELTGHQWWWEVRYPDPQPAHAFVTANEIHIPVGASVKITLRSDDVIHSFWVPNLHGKKDLIPGQDNTFYIAADRPDTFRGQCTEFCGLQHAYMALFVVAEPKEQFARWIATQRRPAPAPANDAARRGQQVFLSQGCPACHTINGTAAAGTTGPDLTHIAGRLSIGAGRLPNTRGNRAGWIVDAQTQKPGNRMPRIALAPDDLQSLLDYLDTLE